MAKEIIKDPVVTINGVDLSDHVTTATVEGTFEDVDLTGFGATSREHGKGLRDDQITLTVIQDFAAGEVDATLWPLFAGDTSFAVAVKAHVGAIAATNPEFQMTAKLLNYSPIAGSIGDASTTDVTLINASPAGIVRDITP